ncbi:MAG: hypothetical protein ACOZF0_05750 [Thermodesulfobacteriota bacterium]
MNDIHDIKPLVRIGYPLEYIRIIAWGLAAAVLLALVIAGIRWYRGRTKPGKGVPPPVPPHESALQQIQALAQLADLAGREFYFRLSAVLRAYIQGRYGIDAPEMTTEELLPKITQLKLDRNLERGIKDFLTWSDPVKFAGISADRNRMRSDLDFAEGFVRKTMAPENGTQGPPATPVP